MADELNGVIPIVLTPLKENGDIDTKSCCSLVDYLIDNGAGGLFALGSASEGFLLNNEQRYQVVHAMAEANRERVPLIVGCSHMAPRNVFEFLSMIENERVQGVHFIPEDLKLGDQQLIYLIETYADRSAFPFYLYHNTKRGRDINWSIANRVKSHVNVCGIKVGGYDQDEMKGFLSLEDDSFQALGAGGGQFLNWLILGAKAVTASSACCFPKLFYKLYQNYVSGDLASAQKHQKKWIDFHSAIPNLAAVNGEYAAEEKYILKKLGVIESDYCHFPYRQLSIEERRQTDDALEKYDLLAP
ncbi:dihydrodipicolinate synthase family protein [uncultured Desulfobacter sp.]|uniref:dihydrodipicolinate synthase family protein n=1 Tax=uncultured Desulfobacter sp. TaxID=240139 RepID=UPI0029F482F7|nr:dihydrodipicolinate synthase family protein [uncultured Desulfobacter sp.]